MREVKNIKKYPYIKQRGLKECGPACVQMILKYHGGYVNIDKLGEMMNTNQNGTTAYNICETLKDLGFNSVGIKTTDFSKIILPCIAHVIVNHSYGHYVVIYKVDYKNNIFLIADPATSFKKITFKEFYQMYSGVVIQMYPIKPIVCEKKPNIPKFIWHYMKNNIKLVLLTNIISSIVSLLSLASILSLTSLLTTFNKKTFIFMILFLFIKEIFILFKNILYTKFNLKLDQTLTMDIFKKIINLPYRYYRRKTTGEITNYLNDLYIVKNTISRISEIIFIKIPYLAILLIILLSIKAELLLFIVLYTFVYIIFYKKTNTILIDKMTREKNKVNSYVIESINGFETIKNLNITKKIQEKFKSYYQSLISITKKIYQNSYYLSFINSILKIVIIIIVFSYANNNLNNFIILYIIISNIIAIIQDFFDFNYNLEELKYSFLSIIELDYQLQKRKIAQATTEEIIIKNLRYSYDRQTEILKGINLTIKNKSKVLVTGSSGSGKSTLFQILKGYYNDYSGTITIGQKDIKNYFFENILYLSSKEYLFTGTLADNLNLKEKNPNSPYICQIEDMVKNNYYQLIEENGFNLSSGQKQRITLARALSNFNILIIDEGLNQVSVDMERKILKNLFKNYKDKIIIYISHRLDNLDLFDQFIKIEKGHIVLNQRRNN